jgi:hypothetical protein
MTRMHLLLREDAVSLCEWWWKKIVCGYLVLVGGFSCFEWNLNVFSGKDIIPLVFILIH